MAWLVANHSTDVPDDILGVYSNEQDHVRSDPFQPFEQDHVLSEPLEISDNVSSNQSDNPAAKSSSLITEESSLEQSLCQEKPLSCDGKEPGSGSGSMSAKSTTTPSPNLDSSRNVSVYSVTSTRVLTDITEFLNYPELTSTPKSSKVKKIQRATCFHQCRGYCNVRREGETEEQEAKELRRKECEMKRQEREQEKIEKAEEKLKREVERKKKAEERELEKKRKAEEKEAERKRKAELRQKQVGERCTKSSKK